MNYVNRRSFMVELSEKQIVSDPIRSYQIMSDPIGSYQILSDRVGFHTLMLNPHTQVNIHERRLILMKREEKQHGM